MADRPEDAVGPGELEKSTQFVFWLMNAGVYDKLMENLRGQINDSPSLMPDIPDESPNQHTARENATILAAIRNIVKRNQPGYLSNAEGNSIYVEVELELKNMATKKSSHHYRGNEGPLSEKDDGMGLV